MVVAGSFRQQAELRKHRRQPLHYPAVIYLGRGEPPRKCMLSDVSNGGARITLGAPSELPDEFVLVLSGRGHTRRNCRVAWREGTILGVEFVRELTRPAAAESASET